MKYPYIPDKTLYAAVMYACKMIRETGWFNKAVEEASDYYDVPEEDIAREIRKRQSVGQKNSSKKRKYKWYIVDEYEHFQYRDDCEEYVSNPYRFKVVRAIDRIHAGKTSDPFAWGADNECYSEICRHVIGEYETKKEAEEALKNYKEME